MRCSSSSLKLSKTSPVYTPQLYDNVHLIYKTNHWSFHRMNFTTNLKINPFISNKNNFIKLVDILITTKFKNLSHVVSQEKIYYKHIN